MTSSSQVCPNIVNFPDAPRAPDHARHGRSIALPHGAARLCVALVADARMHISDGADQVVLDSAMDGSWLLVSMAPGRSRFTVTFQNKILHREVEIPAKGQRERVSDFRSAGEVLLHPARLRPCRLSP